MIDYTAMTTEELQKELDRLSQLKFQNAMADFWGAGDWDFEYKLDYQIRNIRLELQKRGVKND